MSRGLSPEEPASDLTETHSAAGCFSAAAPPTVELGHESVTEQIAAGIEESLAFPYFLAQDTMGADQTPGTIVPA